VSTERPEAPRLQARAPAQQSSSEPRVLICTFAFNEGIKIETTVRRIVAATGYAALVVDDGSTDGSIEKLRQFKVSILSSEKNHGIGSSMKRAFSYAIEHKYDVIVIMAGNNKDDPTEIPRLLHPILRDGFDFVQGSRFLDGGVHGNMPTYRRFATRLHPTLFSLVVGKRLTESTNGFRAFKVSILKDKRIWWNEEWLDAYELEPYLLFKAIRLGYRHTEVPVTKIYPPKHLGYTKMKPITGWWSILRPLLYLGLRIKR
jgi:dolichol-phosphate mannosyltransferase